MFRTSLSAAIGLALVLVAPMAVAAQDDTAEPGRTIIVSGTGQSSAEPDEAIIHLGVNVRAPDTQGAMSKAARRMDAVIAALLEAGVAESDITTVGLDLYQYRQRNAQREVVERGWKVNNRVRAIIRDIDGTSDAIDAAVSAGATDIDSIRFRASDPAEAIAEARVAAVESAATAAATLAGASGLQVLDVVRIVESGQGYPSFYDRGDTAGPGYGAYATSTPIQPGLVDVATTVTVEYEIG